MVKELVVVSGKGGTGKTSISAALAYLAPNKVIVDCDVDAANFHLVSGAVTRHTETFQAGFTPQINKEACTGCGQCTALCRFGAIVDGVITAPLNCEGCGVCAFHCPAHAINMVAAEAGHWFIADSRLGPLVHAELGLTVENSGKLVSKVRQEARKIAEKRHLPLIITDGPPGIGCPAIAALSGADLVLAVVEPSLSSIHDLRRLAELVAHFSLPVVVCINKSTLHQENSRQIVAWCQEQSIPVVGELPYSDTFRSAVQAGKTVMEMGDGDIRECLSRLWRAIAARLDVVR